MKSVRRIVSVFLACLLVCSLCMVIFAEEQQSGSTMLITNVPALVSFAANGGSGNMEVVSVTVGTEYTLPGCSFTAPVGMTFQHWEIDGKTYSPGRTITVNSHVTVTAVWRRTSPGETTVRKLIQRVIRIIRDLFSRRY